MIFKTTLSTVAAFAVLGFGGAQAEPRANLEEGGVVSVVVPTEGLNLRTEQGAEIALQRVHNAAHEVCGVQPDLRDLGPYEAYSACLKTTVDNAVVASHSPIMASLNGTPIGTTQFAARVR